ncbi:MAG: hypothetical protein NTW18_04315 [Candidatus Omnitrophica bacterium]|nr:hypothetical protein [Candidatus Omnitrophota bacterium]
MLKKAFLSAVLLVFVFLSSGCGTLYKGAQGMKEGAKEDWAWLKKSDGWFKDNLW